MNSPLPADLLELKTRFDHWRSTRSHIRQPIPDDLRQAAQDMSRRYSPALVGRVLKLDPHRLKKPIASPPRQLTPLKKPQTDFFNLPTEIIFSKPENALTSAAAGCCLLLERPDGARLTLQLPSLDLTEIDRLCSDFWRS